MHTNYSCLK